MSSTVLDAATFPRCAAAVAKITREENDPAYEEAQAVYAAELLPRLLGETWMKSDRVWIGNLVVGFVMHPLFDHPIIYRRKGARGPNTWGNIAVIGQPYNAMDREGGVRGEAAAMAADLAKQGVGVWCREDLSAWYPGWTQLVVAAPGLLDRDARPFGFIAL